MSESYSQVPEQGKCENGGERESYAMQECHATQPNYEHCKYSTNRGWRDVSQYAELFGTPERAARTLLRNPMPKCGKCIVRVECGFNYDSCSMYSQDALLDWLRGDA